MCLCLAVLIMIIVLISVLVPRMPEVDESYYEAYDNTYEMPKGPYDNTYEMPKASYKGFNQSF